MATVPDLDIDVIEGPGHAGDRAALDAWASAVREGINNPTLATPSTPGAVAKWPPNQTDLGILCIGDSHTEGAVVLASDSSSQKVDRLLASTNDKDWAGSSDSSYFRNANRICNPASSTDANAALAGTAAPSWSAWLPGILRRSYPLLFRRIRLANLGLGGASAFTWSGFQAYVFVNFTGVPSDGDTCTIGSVTYRFKSTPAQVNDIQIDTQGNTARNLGNAISGEGTGFYAGGTPNPDAFAPSTTTAANNNPLVYALLTGVAGNSITVSTTSSKIQFLNAGGGSATAHFVNGMDSPSTFYNDNLVTLVPAGFGSVDLICITLGTNDARRVGYRGRGFATEAARLVAQLRATFPSAKIVWWKPPITSVGAINTALSGTVIPAITALQAANPSFMATFDMYTPGAGSGDSAILNASDGLHLTNYGYSIAASGFAAAAAGLFGWV